MRTPVPERQGWHFAALIQDGPHSYRRGVIHNEVDHSFWVFGDSPEELVIAAQTEIDLIYCRRAVSLAELIAGGDAHGPNVWVLGLESQGDNGDPTA